jgi:hypothetical protein
MSKLTQLGESQITHSPHDVLTIQLVQPADLPAFVQITWPLQPTVLHPRRFPDASATLTRMTASCRPMR